MWLQNLIFFAAGVLSALVVLHFFLKRYMQLHQEVKSTHRTKFQELINRVYHKDQIPRAKRIRGLTNLGLPATLKLLDLQKEILTILIRLLHQVTIIGKEHHYGFAKFAMEETEASISKLRLCIRETESITEYWKLTQQVSLEHEENVISTVKEFEHYQ